MDPISDDLDEVVTEICDLCNAQAYGFYETTLNPQYDSSGALMTLCRECASGLLRQDLDHESCRFCGEDVESLYAEDELRLDRATECKRCFRKGRDYNSWMRGIY